MFFLRICINFFTSRVQKLQHALPISNKWKRDTNKEGEDEHLLRNEIGPEDMELNMNVEELEVVGKEPRLQERRTNTR